MLLFLTLTACGPVAGAPPEPTPVTVQLAWNHSAQFAGFYAAEQQGYYAEEGLAVTFIEGGAQVDRLSPLLEGRVHFSLGSGAELIGARAAGSPIRAVAAILQRDPFAFFSLADSGISRPEDFVGKTIQIRPRSRPFLRAVMNRVGISPDQYTESETANFEDLYSGQIDVAIGFVTAQLLEAEQAGHALNVIYAEDYGVHFYSDVIFTSETLIAENPALVQRFLRATLKGWRYAVEHPAEAGLLVRRYQPEADIALENAKMATSLPLINTGENNIGWMGPEKWAGMVETLRQQGVITSPFEPTEVYTLHFLEEVYQQE